MPIRVTKMYRYSHHVRRYKARYKSSNALPPFMTTFIKKLLHVFLSLSYKLWWNSVDRSRIRVYQFLSLIGCNFRLKSMKTAVKLMFVALVM